jgi:hypothetical protein
LTTPVILGAPRPTLLGKSTPPSPSIESSTFSKEEKFAKLLTEKLDFTDAALKVVHKPRFTSSLNPDPLEFISLLCLASFRSIGIYGCGDTWTSRFRKIEDCFLTSKSRVSRLQSSNSRNHLKGRT